MKVIIKGFRCHTDAEYLLRDGKIILMSGASGAGKSTVLQSIYWCLYGGMRGIYSHNMKSGKISVTLQMNNCTVYRQGRPNLFRVVLNNPSQTHEDQVAQGVIDRMFGPKDLWKACCYIDQNTRCALLTGSNTERMELLNRLSFSTDNPEACISRIDAELKSLREQFTGLQAVYTSECQSFGQELANKPVDPNVMSLISSLFDMRNRIPGMNAELIKLDQTRMEQMRLVGMKKALSENLSQQQLTYMKMKEDPDCKDVNITSDSVSAMRGSILVQEETKLEQYRREHMEYVSNRAAHEHATQEIAVKKEQFDTSHPDESDKIPALKDDIVSTDATILKIEQTVEQIQEYQENMRQLQMMEQELSKYDNDLNGHLSTEYTESDVWQNKQQEQEYAHNSALAQKLGIEYTTEAIVKCRQEHSEKMEFESMLESRLASYSQVKVLEAELLKIPAEDHELTVTDEIVFSARDEYTRLSQSSDLLSCPHCGKSVRYVNNELQPDNMTPVTPDQVKVALDKVSSLFARQNNQKRAIELKSQISTLLPSCGDRNELDQASTTQRMSLSERQSIISQLDQIKVVSKPAISSELMSVLIKYRQLKESTQHGNDTENPSKQPPKQHPTLSLNSSLETFQQQLLAERSKKQQLLDRINAIMINASNRRDLEQSLQQLTLKLSSLTLGSDRSVDIRQCEERIGTYKRQLDKWDQILRVESDVTRLKQQIDAIVIIDDIEDKYMALSKEIETLKSQIEATEYAERMCAKQKSLEQKRDGVVKMTADLTSLQQLRQTAVDVECQQLQTTVDSINNAMADILDNIFEDPITVRIQLYKQLKTNKSLKASVNLSISYRGAEYDSINQMSGGEGDRISFALILALNQVSTSPLLMLDESMSSINANLRESCLHSLRDVVGITKTVLVINHEDVEGHYDDVIRF